MILLLLLSAAVGEVPANSPVENSDAAFVSAAPYCGVYCLYASLCSIGVEVPFEQLLKKQYIGSKRGSSASDLLRAAAECNVHGRFFTDLNLNTVAKIESPVLLHVRRPGFGATFDHWILLLGFQNGAAFILDPPYTPTLVSAADLLAMWNGVGIVISEEPPAKPILGVADIAERVLLCAVLLLALCLARLITPSRFRWSAVSLFAVMALIAILANCCYPTGVFRNIGAMRFVASRHRLLNVPTITTSEARHLLGQPNVFFVDARSPSAFQYGHMPNAVNLPIDASFVRRRAAMAMVAGASHIVVYCQSKSCAWSRAVGSDLILQGCANVLIYEGGWNEWSQATEIALGR